MKRFVDSATHTISKSPFKGDDEDEIFRSILNDDILYPITMNRDSVSLLQQLLTKNPDKRLGSGPDDSESIRKHSFFRGINWNDVMQKKILPPFVPHVVCLLDDFQLTISSTFHQYLGHFRSQFVFNFTFAWKLKFTHSKTFLPRQLYSNKKTSTPASINHPRPMNEMLETLTRNLQRRCQC